MKQQQTHQAHQTSLKFSRGHSSESEEHNDHDKKKFTPGKTDYYFIGAKNDQTVRQMVRLSDVKESNLITLSFSSGPAASGCFYFHIYILQHGLKVLSGVALNPSQSQYNRCQVIL